MSRPGGKSMKTKAKIIPLLLAVIMVIGLMPVGAWAVSTPDSNIFDISEGNITISAGDNADTICVVYGASGTPQTKDNIPEDSNITIIGMTTGSSVTVVSVEANITLDNVLIQSSTSNISSIALTSGASVTLNLKGSNTLKGGTSAAGLQVPSGTAIVIGGSGSLASTGGSYAAGIGGGSGSSGGTIRIENGTITAKGGSNGGAGIGSGNIGSGGTITINGGTVTATGGSYGAGIGGASASTTGGDAGTIVINGGTVTATGGSYAAGIGGGNKGSGGIININGGTVAATSGSNGIGIGEGYNGTGGAVSISDTATVKAASHKTGAAAIDTASGALESESTASIMLVKFSTKKTAMPVTEVYDKNSSSLYTDFSPTVAYQSLAFTVPVGTYYIKTADALQQHGSAPDQSTEFVVSKAGIATFGTVTDSTLNYKITNIDNQTMTVLPYDYASGSQETKTLTITNSGTGDLNNLAVALSGGDTTAFTITPPLNTTLDSSTTSTAFTVTAKDGLATGTYSATVKISADNMVPASTFTVTQVVKPMPTYTIAAIENQNLSALDPGYEAGTQQIKTITIEKTGTEDLNNLVVTLGGTNKSDFVITQPVITNLGEVNPSTTFTIRARDALTAGIYQATVTISADSMSPEAFTVTQAVGTILSSDANLSSLTISTGTLNPEFIPDATEYSVSVSSSISAVMVNPVTSDGNATVKVNGQEVSSGQDSQTITLDVGNNTITVLVTAQDATAKTYTIIVKRASSGSESNSHGSRNTSSSVSTFHAAIPVGTDSIDVPLSADRAEGVATAKLTESILASAFRKIEIDSAGGKSASIVMPKIESSETYVLQLPAAVLMSQYSDRTIRLESEAGTVALPDDMLIGSSAGEDSTVDIGIGNADKSKVSQEVQSLLGSRPMIELSLIVGGKIVPWDNPNVRVTVSIPYTPTAEERKDPEHITVWYIDGSGEAVSVPNGKYDPAAGSVIFTTTHFSGYGVGYVNKTFVDLDSVEWAKKQIGVMASKGILNGTENDAYSPKANITRADYMVMLVKTLGITADFEDNFVDIEPSAYYYDAIGIAKKLGITEGSGNNCFDPNESISRQDMMVLAARAMEKFKELKTTSDTNLLNEFADRGEVDGYALESLSALVKEGLVAGAGNKLNPSEMANRAEAAVFLYNIYNKY